MASERHNQYLRSGTGNLNLKVESAAVQEVGSGLKGKLAAIALQQKLPRSDAIKDSGGESLS